MKRGRVFAAVLLVASALAGCSAIRSGPMSVVGSASEPPPAQTGRYSREAVPDAVMLPNHAGSFYRDSPAP
jgi:hypothetical protein